MKALHEEILRRVALLAAERGLDEAGAGELLESVFEMPSLESAADVIEDELRQRHSEKLAESRAKTRGFVERNMLRWGPAIDLLEFMYDLAAEAGESLHQEWNQEVRDKPYLFCALNHFHAKALVTFREIICLIEAGYADGALARWRTLHELAVCATVVQTGGEPVAERYVASFDFAARKAARQLNEYAQRANLEPYAPEELQELEDRCKGHTSNLGDGLSEEFGWAAQWVGKKSPNLFELEVATGLDHWRPRFRWASQSVHGGYRPPAASLAMAEAQEIGHVIGASNSGMVDPMQMSAISLLIVFANFMTPWTNADRLVAILILQRASDRVGPLAAQLEADSLAAFRSGIADEG